MSCSLVAVSAGCLFLCLSVCLFVCLSVCWIFCTQDTVAVQELRFGDNDTLSAQVATLVEADYLFLLTDVDALYTANPKVGFKTEQPHLKLCFS